MLSQMLLGLGLGPVWDTQLFVPVTGVNGVTCSRDLGEVWRHLAGGF